jgi:hypothetical protein
LNLLRDENESWSRFESCATQVCSREETFNILLDFILRGLSVEPACGWKRILKSFWVVRYSGVFTRGNFQHLAWFHLRRALCWTCLRMKTNLEVVLSRALLRCVHARKLSTSCLTSSYEGSFSGLQVTISMDLVKCSEPALQFIMANEQGWQSWCTTGWIWGGMLRWITMHYIGGCGEMDNIVLRSATSPSCKMTCGDGLRCTTLVDVGRWTILYYDQQPRHLARWHVVMDYDVLHWRMWGDGQHCIMIHNQIAKWDVARQTTLYTQCMTITLWCIYYKWPHLEKLFKIHDIMMHI